MGGKPRARDKSLPEPIGISSDILVKAMDVGDDELEIEIFRLTNLSAELATRLATITGVRWTEAAIELANRSARTALALTKRKGER